MSTFNVGFSPDLPRAEGGGLRFDLGFDLLTEVPDLELGVLPGEPSRELAAEQLSGIDALVLWGAAVTEASLAGADRLRIIARLGVGYDNVDVEACTRRGIVGRSRSSTSASASSTARVQRERSSRSASTSAGLRSVARARRRRVPSSSSSGRATSISR